jgi:D-alanyl-D-alanine carboxypeptidase/D-alanyl-D-alanine-endopeptidase (penicillin-binding protein 4)
VSGVLPAYSARTYSFAIKNVPLAMAAILKYRLGLHGVKVNGSAVSEKVAQVGTPKTLALKDSKLMDLLMQMNKRSDNYLAESMFRKLSTIASVAANAPDERARKLMRSFLQVCNTEGTYCTFIDGSGLSHANRVSANTVIDLLKGIKDQGMFDIFTRTLSIAGYDGTLRHRMIGTSAQYNAHGKTGTLSNVTALAGYVITGDGQLASYFITMQNFRAGIGTYKAAQNLIVQTVAGFRYANYLPPPGITPPGTSSQGVPMKSVAPFGKNNAPITPAVVH